jgi:hypothetical protein
MVGLFLVRLAFGLVLAPSLIVDQGCLRKDEAAQSSRFSLGASMTMLPIRSNIPPMTILYRSSSAVRRMWRRKGSD